MDTKKFETLLRVIDCGSITKAGEDLGYTQSGISHMVKAIERELGFPVLIRNRNGVVPTEDGKKIISALRQLVNWNEQFEQVAASIKGIEIGKVRIGTFTSMSVNWLPRIIKAFQSDYPNIAIELVEGGNQALSSGIENGLIDVGFGSYPTGMEADWIPLFEDFLMAVLPPTYDIKDLDVFPIQRFNHLPFITLSESFDCEVQQIFKRNYILPDVKFSSTDDYTIIAMVRQGLGCSILPQMVLQGYKHCNVQTLALEPECRRQLGIVLPSLKDASPATKKFVQCAKTIINQALD
ncbi:LysR family transcriptional regulator [Oscillibacter sp.]|uniref:LysR family transcriptional regulator n=1 Tax=Oscillibacter sp. TaxID=1945593 RepID=UPI0028A936A2|nr:LysR family transcriptional regulator [Oscillibacter sp.]